MPTAAPPDDFPADCLASVRMAVQHVADALYAAERVHRQVRHRDDVRDAISRASAILATAAFRAVLRHLRGCSLAELNWLKMDGLREVQRERIEPLPPEEDRT